MNKSTKTTLKILRKLYTKTFGNKNDELPKSEQNPDIASRLIYDALTSDKPCMIARFGSTELTCLINYIGVKNHKNNYSAYIKGSAQPWWWQDTIRNQMQQWSGFFPPTIEKIEQFCELMLQDIPEVNILGSWLAGEQLFDKELKHTYKIRFIYLEPFWAKQPWTKALKGKKVLVVHPFAKTIQEQYKKRADLFDNEDVLPEFDLKTIKAVQSIAGTKTEFSDWFEALEYMKAEIDKTDYDICLIGAGAYGFPLAAHVKRKGKKAVHIGGSLQLLFGIRGKRWENNYNENYDYTSLINKYWVHAGDKEKPVNANIVEDGCYW